MIKLEYGSITINKLNNNVSGKKKVEIDNYSSLKKGYSIIKNNLTMILLIPTMIGGIWQIFSLLNIGLEYIRFFSISQLVADGLVMVIIIPITAILPIFAYYIVKSIRLSVLKKDNEPSFFKQFCYFLISFLILLFLVNQYLDYISPALKKKPSFFIDLLAFLLFIPLTVNCFLIGNRVFERYEIYYRYFRRKNHTMLGKVLISFINLFNMGFIFTVGISAFLSAAFAIVAFFGILDSLGEYYMSDNLANIKNIEKVMKKEYDLDSNDYSIEYFNDSYIFLEHITVSKKERDSLSKKELPIPTEIIILKFDRLFENE